jgi:hypothetical protein
MRLALPFAICLVLASAATLAYATTSGAWTQIDDDEGIRIWKLEIPGVEVPGFRGETVMNASAERIVEELKHVEWHTQWMYRCSESAIIKRIDEDAALIYNRTDTPWPVWDRDVVLDTAFTTSADHKVITLTFKNTDPTLRPLPEHVIRMPRLEGSYRMEKVAENKTKVTYTVEVDIGGSIPAWMAKMVARDMPYKTLSSLRNRLIRP